MLTTSIDLADDHRRELLEDAKTWHESRNALGTPRGRAAGAIRPLAVALIGLVLIGLSASTLLVTLHQDETPADGHQPEVVIPNQLATVTTADLVYEPGHSSGWHVHPGLHAVVVLSGTLTVYDQACIRQDYGPGQTYLGGREPHVARNESGEPTRMVAAYVPDGRAAGPGSPVGAPGGCQAVA